MFVTFMDIQVHLLIYLVDDIEIVGVISSRSIYFVERFLKVLKDLLEKNQDQKDLCVRDILYKSIFLCK